MKAGAYTVILFIALMQVIPDNGYTLTNRCMTLSDYTSTGYYFFEDTLNRLKQLYVNYLAINAFVYQDTETNVEIYKHSDNTATDDALVYIIDQAHTKGFRVFLKINVDAVNGEWRGNFAPTNADIWFQNYQSIMTQYAVMAEQHSVEMFSAGCEFRSLAVPAYAAQWSNVIEAIRRNYTGKLTYSADWQTYTNKPFWNQLDYIGIDAYFPLDKDDDASAQDLKNDWFGCDLFGGSITYNNQFHGINWVAQISNFKNKYTDKPVWFAEAGCGSADNSLYDPAWYAFPVPNMTAQSNYYEGFFNVWTNYNWFMGMFWWDARRSPYYGGSGNVQQTPLNKPAENVLKKCYQNLSAQNITNTNIYHIPSLYYPVNNKKVNSKDLYFIWSAFRYNFDWEDGTIQAWYPNQWDPGFNVFPFHQNTTEKTYHGSHALKCHTVLTQDPSGYKSAFLWFDPPETLDLRGKKVSVACWIPGALIWPLNPNVLNFGFVNSSYQYTQGTGWHDLVLGDQWQVHEQQLSNDLVLKDVIMIGVKIYSPSGLNNDTAFDGYIYLDAYSCGVKNKYWLQVAADPFFQNLIINAHNITQTNYLPVQSLAEGQYYWRVKVKMLWGWQEWSSVQTFQIREKTTSQNKSDLLRYQSKAYPNPCSRSEKVIIEYGYAEDKEIEQVQLSIYDLWGNQIYQVSQKPVRIGRIEWLIINNNFSKIVPGLYLYRLIISYADGVQDRLSFKKIVISP